MFQPMREQVLHLNLCEKVQIDGMSFHIKRFQADVDNDGSLMITLFGEKPNATTFNHNRLIKLDDLIWRPVEAKMSFTTLENKIYFEDNMSEDDIREFMSIQNSGDDEIINLWVEVTTRVNPPLSYFFKDDDI